MFEAAIINKLATDGVLTDVLSEYNEEPSIFSDEAPEGAEFPYIVVRIFGGDRVGPVQSYRCDVDVFDYNKSRVNSRIAAQQIEYDLDDNRLTSKRFIDLRIILFSGPTPIEDEDPRDIRITTQFEVRATRSKWMISTK